MITKTEFNLSNQSYYIILKTTEFTYSTKLQFDIFSKYFVDYTIILYIMI